LSPAPGNVSERADWRPFIAREPRPCREGPPGAMERSRRSSPMGQCGTRQAESFTGGWAEGFGAALKLNVAARTTTVRTTPSADGGARAEKDRRASASIGARSHFRHFTSTTENGMCRRRDIHGRAAARSRPITETSRHCA
jgi:hypothetical protein